MTLRIGKHKGKTYSCVADSDRSYCAWVLRLGPSSTSSSLDKFCTYLKKHYGGILPVGRHKMKFYAEIVEEDKDYCAWAVQQKCGEPLRGFVEYLKKVNWKDADDDKEENASPSNECKICCASHISCVLVPCGHRAMCSSCAGRVDSCPFCKQPIALVQQRFDL